MQTISYFILNELLWSFIGNFLYAIGHPLPLMPAVCFRMDGLIGRLLRTEQQRAIYFIVIVILLFNCCLGFLSTFLYRYVTLAFSSWIARFHRAWGYMYFIVGHLIISLIVALLFHMWHLPVDRYPKEDLPENTENLFCYHPEGIELTIVGAFFFLTFGGGTFLIALFAGLSYRELMLKRKLMEKKTLLMQKEILKNLIIITATAVFLGGLPLAVVVFYFYNGKLPLARNITSASMMISLNFGTFYAIVILIRFKYYRKAVVDMARSVFRRVCNVFTGTSSNAVFSHVSNVKY
uniref:G_PROTEIN_RECEP_F1_2 domain-containing protein n=1 Tax=Steinernema glaseri TaxID=37863 RepID=A0A1I7Y901_9BILA